VIPKPEAARLPVFKLFCSDHELPLYSSVSSKEGVFPPKASAAVCIPAPSKPALPVFKLPPLAQAAGVTVLTLICLDILLYQI
jgi:hypothetical protein